MDKRYHVHVCYASEDLHTVRSLLMQKLARHCFFTWSLQDDQALATNYSRQQIDSCDFVIILIGSKYGKVSVSGVSYLHLDMIYANSKLKPILAFMQDNSGRDDTLYDLEINAENIVNKRKLVDFRKNVSTTCSNICNFVSDEEFADKVTPAFERMVHNFPSNGWLPATKTMTQISLSSAALPIVEPSGEFETHGIEKTSLHEKFIFSYTVQAFKDGNLKEVKLPYELTWGEILNIVADCIRMPASEDMIPKTIYEYLDEISLQEVQKTIPLAHATARSQMSQSDIQNIKLQLLANDWISSTSKSANGKKLFILTPQGARKMTQWRGNIERQKAIASY